jgi:hypothetical protein
MRSVSTVVILLQGTLPIARGLGMKYAKAWSWGAITPHSHNVDVFDFITIFTTLVVRCVWF